MDEVVIAGGSGFLGRALAARLAAEGTPVVILSRRSGQDFGPGIRRGAWGNLAQRLEGARAVVNLAGENLAGGRWTRARMDLLRSSRVEPTRWIVEALSACTRPPSVLVNASGAGYYGDTEVPVDEGAPPGSGFLADTCVAWEAEAVAAERIGIRVLRLRMGVVLAREGGALPRLALPVRCFAGAPLGHGRQGFPWIHLEDLLGLVQAALSDARWRGAVNAVAPSLTSQGEFTRSLGRVLRRPILPLPPSLSSGVLKVLLGRMADEMLLGGAFVRPAAALERGFGFGFPDARAALQDLLGPVRPLPPEGGGGPPR
ncbi:MAG: TIGR01777 family protein [Acidobacteria bacterium]|nr:TIGR01777 family protein [Acidobacteriota bacterium]